jgi:hypothetical protein
MAQTPWKAFAKPHPERDDVAAVSYLTLKTFWALPHLGVAEFCVGKRKSLTACLAGSARTFGM